MALTREATETYKRLFGSDPAPSPTDAEALEILQNEIFGEVFSTPGLTDAEREQLTVAVLAAMQTLPQLTAHLNAALNVGLTPIQLRETIYQLAPYIGWPKTLNATVPLAEVLKAHGVELSLEEVGTVAYEDRAAAGAAIQEPLYGTEIAEVFAALPEPYGEFLPHLLTANAFGDFETRGVLDVADRELISLVAIAALGAATQLKPHVAGAIKAGNSKQKVAAALVRVLPYIGAPLRPVRARPPRPVGRERVLRGLPLSRCDLAAARPRGPVGPSRPPAPHAGDHRAHPPRLPHRRPPRGRHRPHGRPHRPRRRPRSPRHRQHGHDVLAAVGLPDEGGHRRHGGRARSR
ncbi:carboxymuconolactone decarboxylase family protein [Actinomyces radicidentis]|uniref:carboxymuconolactone decarboxylase family protein n=1 Tax=Actinomyces radicidentis TaxID=111015 RepID=UPI0028F00379|nr:carboxymuconolactone decarboxylase family protein [Actinomyces radicidentis]